MLHGQGVKGPLAHGQRPDVDGRHGSYTSLFNGFGFCFFGGRGLGSIPLQLLQLGLQGCNVTAQGFLGGVVGGLVRLKCLDLGVNGGFLLGVAGFYFVDGGFQLGFPGLKTLVLALQVRQFSTFGVQRALEHQNFQHLVVSFRVKNKSVTNYHTGSQPRSALPPTTLRGGNRCFVIRLQSGGGGRSPGFLIRLSKVVFNSYPSQPPGV